MGQNVECRGTLAGMFWCFETLIPKYFWSLRSIFTALSSRSCLWPGYPGVRGLTVCTWPHLGGEGENYRGIMACAHRKRSQKQKVASYPNQDVSVYFNGNVHFEVLVIEFYRQHPIRVKTWGPKRSSWPNPKLWSLRSGWVSGDDRVTKQWHQVTLSQ